jgi:rfaE bifunctional protein nucleotidyltransferase chain/domain
MNDRSFTHAPILDRVALVEFVNDARSRGETIILTNGCFDILHVGHVRYLAGAKELEGTVIVGINSDEQVRRLKGDGRPVQNQDERAEIVASIVHVDAVTIFEEPTVEELIRAIRPDIHAKGTDYAEASVPERDIVLSVGGRVAIVGDPKDHSSSSIISNLSNHRDAKTQRNTAKDGSG